jgi:choline dehydrogenase-like flavoprotein/predicted dehydrogenase
LGSDVGLGMKFFDLRRIDENSTIQTDLCIIGSGPAGLSIAKELARTNIDVLVLEGGGLEPEPDTQALYDFESVGVRRQYPAEATRVRVFGGTSRVWTGRCAPFAETDFEQRSWVPHSGWPLTRAELDPYLARAGEILGLGPHRYDESLWHLLRVAQPEPPLDRRILEPMFWQFSKRPAPHRGSTDVGRDLVFPRAENVSVLLHANVMNINTNIEGTKVESVEVSTLQGRRGCVRAKAVVLACGGIENARLLLASNRVMPRGVGNGNDLVGRYLMDHPRCTLGVFDPISSGAVCARFGHYWLDDQNGRHTYLHGVTFSKQIQEAERLMKCDAYIETFDVADDDPWQTLRRLVRTLKSKRLKAELLRDSKSLLGRSGEIGRGLYRRIVAHRPELVRSKRVELHCLVEQVPDPDSRVTLSADRRDALGMPLSTVNWKIGENEFRSARRMNQLILEEFQRLSLPLPSTPSWLEKEADWIQHFEDKAHPTGTTRISINSKDGVVDPQLQVHGVQGLFVTGSSAFPTSGAANPTLMITALSLRLADWLRSDFFRPHRQNDPMVSHVLKDYYMSAEAKSSPGRVRVGLVGAGQRITETYLPILNALSDRYEVVGFTTRSIVTARKVESENGIPFFASASELIEQRDPTFIVSAVASQFNESTLLNLIDLNRPILTETPLAWTIASGSRIIRKAAEKNVVIGVAEQFPFLPLEQLKNRLIELGVFGEIYAVYNDFSSYAYHGIAQIRRYLQGKPTHARSVDYDFGTVIDPRRSDRTSNIRWQVGSVAFDTGAMAFQQYSDYYVDSGVCFPQTTRIYGKNATMINGDLRYFDHATGQLETASAVREQNDVNTTASISINLRGHGVITFKNAYAKHAFTDDQIAVATLLDGMSRAIQTAASPLYTAQEFLTETAIMQAFRYSSDRNGAVLRVPCNETLQRIRSLTNLRRWKKKLLRMG